MGRKVMIFSAGFILTTLGVALILQQWSAVVLLFKGTIGVLVTLLGLVILFASTL